MTSLIRKSLRRNRDPDAVTKPKGTEFTINLLDGTPLTCYIDRKDKGQAILDKIVQELDLNEHEYFGLCWRDKNALRIWVDPEKPIRKQLGAEETTLDFTVRFYAEDPCQLTEEYTRYFFCLQIKQDLLAGKLPCSFYTGALLASYAVQAEVGDYDPGLVDEDGIAAYIREMEFVPGQNEEFECQVGEFHKSHAGQTPADAEMNMLDKVKRLELYGVDLHQAMDLDGIRLYIGISPTGVRIYQAGDMVRMNSFNWAKVLQVSFHKDKFYIQLRPTERSCVKDKIGFRIPSVASCKVLWKSCVDHHTFFRLYVAEKRMPAVLGLFRSGSKYRASVRGTQKQALERSKSTPRLDNLPVFERTASQRIGKSRSEGAINLLNADDSRPYHVRNSFYDSHRRVPSDERLHRPSDNFMVTTTVSPITDTPTSEVLDDHLYSNMSTNSLPRHNAPTFIPPPPPEADYSTESVEVTPVYATVSKPTHYTPPDSYNDRHSPEIPQVEHDSVEPVNNANTVEEDRINIKNRLADQEEREQISWQDKMHHNLDDEWLELDRLTQDVARMTDDLAMDLDLDGPEKNVYVVNPSNPIIYSPPN